MQRPAHQLKQLVTVKYMMVVRHKQYA